MCEKGWFREKIGKHGSTSQQNHYDRDIHTNDTKLTLEECNQCRTRPDGLILSLLHDAMIFEVATM